MGWLEALHTVVCGTKNEQSSGALPFYAFPNELLKAVVERTGGRPVELAAPQVAEGTVELDEEGRCFLVETLPGADGRECTKMTFLLAVTPDGKVVYDSGRVEWVHPFPYRAGVGEIRDGKLQVPGTRRLPQVLEASKPR